MKNRVAIFLVFIIGALSFFQCENQKDGNIEVRFNQQEKEEYLAKGKDIAARTLAVLSGQLQKALGEGDINNAIASCNIRALSLTDSLSNAYNADIRRTSLNIRNPMNSPSCIEAEQLKTYQKQFNKGEDLQPHVEFIDDHNIAFYAPIVINEFCLNCHGSPGDDIGSEEYKIINQYYPDDQATGYREGDLRGMWSIRFLRSD